MLHTTSTYKKLPVLDVGNVCMSDTRSCSACCGLFNLQMNDVERRKWIAENTNQFLALDISAPETIAAFRKSREASTLNRRVRDDIYVCPFVGEVAAPSGSGTGALRTGCLLHPQGSPHPQINLWPHPQNFSFYGEGICLSYDCLAKERRAYRADFFRWAETAPLFAYSRLASDHTLHRTLAQLQIAIDLAQFYSTLAELYADHNVVTTSFEDIEKILPATKHSLCTFLAERIDANATAAIAARLLEHMEREL